MYQNSISCHVLTEKSYQLLTSIQKAMVKAAYF